LLPPRFQKQSPIDAIDAGADMPYDIPNFHVEYSAPNRPGGAPTGSGAASAPTPMCSRSMFSWTSFARKAGKDPVEFPPLDAQGKSRACRPR